MDNRVRLMNELLSGMKVIKLYGWNNSFEERVGVYRRREVGSLRKIGVVFSFLSIMFQSAPLLVALVSFAVYATHGGPNGTPGDINPQRIFVSITLFNLLNRPLGMFSHIIAELIGVTVASSRIQKFLLAEEVSESSIDSSKSMPDDPNTPVIEIKDGVFAWEQEGPEVETEKEKKKREKLAEKKYKRLVKEAKKAGKPAPERDVSVEKNYGPTLVDVNLKITRGDLTAVVGRVGQGKTSLLSAVIGEVSIITSFYLFIMANVFFILSDYFFKY
jgi:ABC-type multidrug transport system fused ATPase/permease subunit